MTAINTTNNAISTASQTDMMRAWLSFVDASEKTAATYARAIRQFAIWLDTNGITAPTRENVLQYRNHLATIHKPATVQAYLAAVKQFYKFTAHEGIYPNIAERVKSVKVTVDHKKDSLTAAQAASMLKTIDTSTLSGKRDYAMMALMLTAGLRTIEVVRAQIGDIKPRESCMVLYVQGKGHTEKDAFVKLSKRVENAIMCYLSARAETATDAPLFASHAHRNNGAPLTVRSVSRLCKGAMLAAGIDSDRLTAHSFRHTAATLNLLAGGTPQETQQLLRHTNINTTMIYAHNIARMENDSENRITTAIFGA